MALPCVVCQYDTWIGVTIKILALRCLAWRYVELRGVKLSDVLVWFDGISLSVEAL